MDYNLEDLQWKCQDCDASAPPTASECMKLLKHKKGHHIRLINTKTGDILATSVKQALSKGIDIPSDGKPSGKPWEKPSGKSGQKEGGDLATVLQPSRGAIIFTLGEHRISLNPQHLYDAYLYYEDISLRHEIDEDFSLALKDAMKYVWERLNQHKSEREGAKITIEGG